MTQMTPHENTATQTNLYMGMDLGGRTWKLAFSNGSRFRFRTVEAWNLDDLAGEVSAAKEKLAIAEGGQVVSCHEAGRDGFSVHRAVQRLGLRSFVVDSSSIEVDRRKRRAKTDRLDAKKLVRQLLRYLGGDTDSLRVVRVPSVEQEDERRPSRERERLQKEIFGHTNRIKSLLATQGIKEKLERDVVAQLETMELPPRLKAELVREAQRLVLARQQLAELDAQRRERLRNPAGDPQARKVLDLAMLCGVGTVSAWLLVAEVFGWRKFRNRKEVGASVGLVPTPFISEDGHREQGISKSGNKRPRRVINELAWLWLRYQPDSALTQWYYKRWGAAGGRARKVGITALSRRLMIALWRYLEDGVVPQGAKEKAIVRID